MLINGINTYEDYSYKINAELRHNELTVFKE